jgi:hypothetical protein
MSSSTRKRDRDGQRRLEALFDQDKQFHAPNANSRPRGLIVPPPVSPKLQKRNEPKPRSTCVTNVERS